MNAPALIKWVAVLVLLTFVSASGPSPAPAKGHRLVDWTSVDEQSGRCRFSFPGGYRRETQTDQVIYSVDSDNLSYQMHYFNTANVEPIGGANAPVLAQPRSVDPATERLNQYATLLAQATNGQVVAQYVIYVSGRQGREVELTYTEPEGDQTIRMLSRFFWQNDMIHVFSVSAPTQYTNTLLDARNTYFNSIQFY